MKIALTYNLRRDDSEEQAEFDSPKTIKLIYNSLHQAGHEVIKVELNEKIEKIIRKLRRLEPDLIFNTAEGNAGRLREAFWPSVFEHLGIPCTGADSYGLALTLDKNLTKYTVAKRGVQVPKGIFLVAGQIPNLTGLKFPLFMKPNYEGSSKGIKQEGLVYNQLELENRLKIMLKQYPDGVVVEEYIEGKDVSVPFLEVAENSILTPVEYIIHRDIKTNIYDYDLKNFYFDDVEVKKAELSPKVLEKVLEQTRLAIKAVDCRDLGRLDFRITPNGQVYFLEINCLPSLEKGASLYFGASQTGLNEVDCLNLVIKSAMMRYPKLRKKYLEERVTNKKHKLAFGN